MKKNIAIVTGGYSGESVISYKTAKTAFDHIDRDLFVPYFVDIRKDGWFGKVDEAEYLIDKNDFSFQYDGQKVAFDCAYLALHGTPGEDGKLQGYFDLIGMPYNTGNTLNLSVTFNKKFTTSVLGMMGFNVAKSLLFRKEEQLTAEQQINEKLSYPLFVKPNNGGSSIGISKVNDAAALSAALTKAFGEDSEIIVEEFITGREFTCGVAWYDGKAQALPVTEIITHNEFFDFNAKYEGNSEEITPANLPETETRLVQSTAEAIYQALECKSIIRIDFIFGEKGIFVIEVNTIPGMSQASIVPQQLAKKGFPLTDVITQQINRVL
ncbi:MAG: D-alanine--D-alanine ligase [Bacteroidota bacterium]